MGVCLRLDHADIHINMVTPAKGDWSISIAHWASDLLGIGVGWEVWPSCVNGADPHRHSQAIPIFYPTYRNRGFSSDPLHVQDTRTLALWCGAGQTTHPSSAVLRCYWECVQGDTDEKQELKWWRSSLSGGLWAVKWKEDNYRKSMTLKTHKQCIFHGSARAIAYTPGHLLWEALGNTRFWETSTC